MKPFLRPSFPLLCFFLFSIATPIFAVNPQTDGAVVLVEVAEFKKQQNNVKRMIQDYERLESITLSLKDENLKLRTKNHELKKHRLLSISLSVVAGFGLGLAISR